MRAVTDGPYLMPASGTEKWRPIFVRCPVPGCSYSIGSQEANYRNLCDHILYSHVPPRLDDEELDGILQATNELAHNTTPRKTHWVVRD